MVVENKINWRKVLTILRYLAIIINVIIFMLGIGLLTAGTYEFVNVDFGEIIRQQYEDSVSDMHLFQQMFEDPDDLRGNNSAKILADHFKKNDAFFKKQIENMDHIDTNIIVGTIVLGVFLALFAMLGVIVFTCGAKAWIFVIIYLVLSILLTISVIIAAYYMSDVLFLQKAVFKILDDIAYSEDPPNRFFMAVLQYTLSCCGVRGPLDYYCHGTYDYLCNSGCETITELWNVMISTGRPPVCRKTVKLEEACLLFTTKPECDMHLNIVTPIDATGDPRCKGYETLYNLKGILKKKLNFTKWDLGFVPAPNAVFQVRSSFYSETDNKTRGLYPIDPRGCGFAAWDKFWVEAAGNAFEYAFYATICGSISLAFLIVLAGSNLYIIWTEKQRKMQEESTRRKKGEPSVEESPDNNIDEFKEKFMSKIFNKMKPKKHHHHHHHDHHNDEDADVINANENRRDDDDDDSRLAMSKRHSQVEIADFKELLSENR